MAGSRSDKKSVLVTGCTPGGIGHSICLEYHARGLHVIASARNPDVLAFARDYPGMSTLVLDVTSAESIKAAVAQVAVLTGGKLDILVNNAGRSHTHPATDIDLDDVRATFETNVFSVMAMVQAFAPQLIEAKGLILNISSISSLSAYVFGSVYCATKGAVSSYSRTLRLELQPFGVRVMVALAGTVRSNAATQWQRTLPPGSLYTRVADLFQKRLTWSQNNATVPTDVFARKLVSASLAPEVPSILRSWLGRPDWFWGGGNSTTLWFGSWLGEWIVDAVCWRKFGLARLQSIVQREGVKRVE